MPGHHIHLVSRPLLTLIALAVAVGAMAKPIPDGPLPPLKEGEGYLLAAVDTDTFLISLHLNRLGHMFGSQRLEKIEPGRQLRVLAVPAGEYRWSRVETASTSGIGEVVDAVAMARMFGTQRFDITDLDTSIRFTVEAGKLNYPGDLHFRLRALGGALSMAMPNRGERALELLARQHGNPPVGIAMRYAGSQSDVYWKHREAGWAATAAAGCPDNLDELPKGKPSATALFHAEEIHDLRFSPDGSLVLETAYRGNQHSVNVIDPASGDVLPLYAGIASVSDAQWAGRRRVVIELRSSSGVTGTHLFSLAPGSLPGQSPTRLRFPVQGYVVDPLPDDEDALLYAVFRPGHADPLQIFRIDLSRRAIDARQFEARKRIDRMLDNDRAWVSDRRGQLRLAVIESEGARHLMYRADGESGFTPLRTVSAEAMFAPQWLSPDGSIYALSNEARDQVELVRMDPAAPDILETVHAIPGIDLSGVQTSGADGRIVGVNYYEGGQARSHFFDENIRSWHSRLLATFPGHYTEPLDIDTAHGQALVMVSSDTAPPRYFHFDVASGKASHIADGAPWLAGETFVGRQAIDVEGQDGRIVQALLALPEGDAPRPLLLMPHGGPFFVQDVLRFDRDVQYWATRGFAVLQANFRGSYGFGVQHLLEGFAGFGRQIEDDIMAALRHVLAAHGDRIDAGRICAIGSSYGGYSSLMLTLRDPALIRCAVSIAGPTDLPLLYMASDWNGSEVSTDAMRRVLGDPDDPALVTHSPLYRANEFSRPVMLIHGSNDRRVDLEHSARLAMRLERLGKPYEMIHLERMGHGAETVGQYACVLGHAERFIREQLAMPGEAPTARP